MRIASFFSQIAHSHSISTHNQFVPIESYKITILDIKMFHCYFLIKLYDLLGKLYEAVQTMCRLKYRYSVRIIRYTIMTLITFSDIPIVLG